MIAHCSAAVILVGPAPRRRAAELGVADRPQDQPKPVRSGGLPAPARPSRDRRPRGHRLSAPASRFPRPPSRCAAAVARSQPASRRRRPRFPAFHAGAVAPRSRSAAGRAQEPDRDEPRQSREPVPGAQGGAGDAARSQLRAPAADRDHRSRRADRCRHRDSRRRELGVADAAPAAARHSSVAVGHRRPAARPQPRRICCAPISKATRRCSAGPRVSSARRRCCGCPSAARRRSG